MSIRRFATIALAAGVLAVCAPVDVSSANDASPSAATTPAAASVKATVISWRSWIHDDALYIAGEMENTSAYTMNGWVQFGISPGHDSDEETLYDTVPVSRLVPGGRSPFLIRRAPFYPDSMSIIRVSAGGYVTGDAGTAVGVSTVSTVGSDPALVGGTGDSVNIEVRNWTARPVRIIQAIVGFRSASGTVSNVAEAMHDLVVPPGEAVEVYAQAGPTGVLATRATVDIVARFDDGAGEPVVSWHNWFHDLGASFRADIAWLAEAGITAGCDAYNYCPDANVTRAQMAMFLDRALDLPDTAIDYFSDDIGKTGEASINRLAASGITGGCAPGRFCPSAAVTRGQMAAFLARALNLPGTATDFFTDDETSTFESSINRVAAAGITGGCGGGKYCPLANVTRGQMAAFLHRALD